MMSRFHRAVVSLAILVSAALVLAACAPAAPPAPTAAPKPAAPTAAPAAAPTKAPAAAPTKAPEPTKPAAAAPAKKIDFPEKGKTAMMIVPYPAGGGSSLAAQLLITEMEKQLGITMQMVNKGGAGTQIGITDLVRSRPDGYNLAQIDLPTTITLWWDKERQAIFARKDMNFVGHHVTDPMGFLVKPDSPFKSIKDMVDAAKANPGKVKVSYQGTLTVTHLDVVLLEKAAGVQFAQVNIDGGGPSRTALLGGHTDAMVTGLGPVIGDLKTNTLRMIGAMTPEIKSFFPDIKTMEEQGYKGFMGQSRTIVVPPGTPKEIVDVLTQAMQKSMQSETYQSKVKDTGHLGTYLTPEKTAAFWDETEKAVTPILEEAQKQVKSQ